MTQRAARSFCFCRRPTGDILSPESIDGSICGDLQGFRLGGARIDPHKSGFASIGGLRVSGRRRRFSRSVFYACVRHTCVRHAVATGEGDCSYTPMQPLRAELHAKA
jgi:hypothetical protein